MWALGIILYMLKVARPPFNIAHVNEIRFRFAVGLVQNGSIAALLAYDNIVLNADIVDLLSHLIVLAPEGRLRAVEALARPFFA